MQVVTQIQTVLLNICLGQIMNFADIYHLAPDFVQRYR